MKSFRPLALLLGVVLIASCDKNPTLDISAPAAGAAVKFFNFGVGDTTVNFYADEQKLTTGSSTSCSSSVNGTTSDTTCLNGGKEAKTGTGYGGGANGGGLYSSIAPGSYTLSARLTTTADIGTTIASMPVTLADGGFYSYYLSGIYNKTAKTVEGFFIEDPIPAPDYSQAEVRFVNAISNSQPMTLYAKNQTSGVETAIGPAIGYKSAGAFVGLPTGTYDLSTRVAGSSTNVILREGVGFAAGRVYTITAYGDITATKGSAVPALDNTTNR